MGPVFAEMSSYTALTWYTVMKTPFKLKNVKSESFGTFIIKLIKLGFSATVVYSMYFRIMLYRE